MRAPASVHFPALLYIKVLRSQITACAVYSVGRVRRSHASSYEESHASTCDEICRYKLKRNQVRAHVDRMLEAVNLPGFANRQTHTLSGGQKQRVAIAGALAECPRVRDLPLHSSTPALQYPATATLSLALVISSHRYGPSCPVQYSMLSCYGVLPEEYPGVQVLLLDELTTFLDGEDQRGVLEAVRRCVGGADQASPKDALHTISAILM